MQAGPTWRTKIVELPGQGGTRDPSGGRFLIGSIEDEFSSWNDQSVDPDRYGGDQKRRKIDEIKNMDTVRMIWTFSEEHSNMKLEPSKI